jgi:hypothetical protein
MQVSRFGTPAICCATREDDGAISGLTSTIIFFNHTYNFPFSNTLSPPNEGRYAGPPAWVWGRASRPGFSIVGLDRGPSLRFSSIQEPRNRASSTSCRATGSASGMRMVRIRDSTEGRVQQVRNEPRSAVRPRRPRLGIAGQQSPGASRNMLAREIPVPSIAAYHGPDDGLGAASRPRSNSSV